MTFTGQPDHAASPLETARSLTEAIEAGLPASRAEANIPVATVDAWIDSNLAWMIVPKELGGGEASAREYYEVIEQFSYLDGATGWTFMANANCLGLVGAFLPDQGVEDVFAERRSLAAGQIAPLGTAERQGEEYRMSGRFGFASGSNRANWICGGYRELSDGEMVRLPNGMPQVLAAVHPRETVEFLGNWDVIGLEATGSVDYAVPEQLVPEHRTWSLFTAEPLRGGGFYRMGVNGMTAITHAAFATGVARRALDEVAAIADGGKRRVGRAALIDDPVFQSAYAHAEASLSAARAFALGAIEDLEAAAQAEAVTRPLRARTRLAATYAAQTSVAVTRVAYEFSGSHGLRNGSAIQRCYRDISASEAHFFTDHNSMRDAGQVLLGVAPDSLYL